MTTPPEPMFIGLEAAAIILGIPLSTLRAEAATHMTICNGRINVLAMTRGSDARRGRLVVSRKALQALDGVSS